MKYILHTIDKVFLTQSTWRYGYKTCSLLFSSSSSVLLKHIKIRYYIFKIFHQFMKRTHFSGINYLLLKYFCFFSLKWMHLDYLTGLLPIAIVPLSALFRFINSNKFLEKFVNKKYISPFQILYQLLWP